MFTEPNQTLLLQPIVAQAEHISTSEAWSFFLLRKKIKKQFVFVPFYARLWMEKWLGKIGCEMWYRFRSNWTQQVSLFCWRAREREHIEFIATECWLIGLLLISISKNCARRRNSIFTRFMKTFPKTKMVQENRAKIIIAM